MRLLRLRGPLSQWCEPGTPSPLTLTLSTTSGKPTTLSSSSRRFVSASPVVDDMADLEYRNWTKEGLVRKIKKLENELRLQTSNHNNPSTEHPPQQQDEPTPPSPAEAAATAGKKKAARKAAKAAALDPSRYSTRFVALKLAYIGKRYNGFEYQAAGARSTIEEELWKALVKGCLVFPARGRAPDEVDWSVCGYSKCGRTDRGVSAFGQVVALRVRSNKPLPGGAGAGGAGKSRKPAGGGDSGGMSTATATTTEEGEELGGSKDVSTVDGGMETSSPPAAGEEANEGDNGDVDVNDDDDAPFPVEKELQYCRMLNRLLPPDIRVYAWCPDPAPDFSARFNCRERQYRYFFTQPAFAPLPNFLEGGGTATNHNNSNTNKKKPKDGWLDIDAMRQAAKLFEGLHDFRNFCKVDPSKQITNFRRRIFEADIVEVDGADTCIPYLTGPQFRDPNIVPSSPSSSSSTTTTTSPPTSSTPPPQRYPKVYYFHVRGSAFLWHQIRCMVAVLFLVGQGLEPPEVVASLLDTAAHPRRPNYVLADDAPLVLWDCLFGRDRPGDAPDELGWVYVGDEGAGGGGGSGGRGGGGGSGVGGDVLDLHGPSGLLASDLWARWREAKMDEVLAGQLVDWVARKTGAAALASSPPPPSASPSPSPSQPPQPQAPQPHQPLQPSPTATPNKTKTKNNHEDKAHQHHHHHHHSLTKLNKSTRIFEGGNGARFGGRYVPVLAKDLLQTPEEQNDRYAQRKGFGSAEEMRAGGKWREVIRAGKGKGKGGEVVGGEGAGEGAGEGGVEGGEGAGEGERG